MNREDAARCPLCGQPNHELHPIMICGNCHHNVQALHNVDVSRTSEFHASDVLAAADLEPKPRQVREPYVAGSRCSWCHKPEANVKKLLSRDDAHICNECVALCADIMAAELGPDWRG